MPFFSQLLHLAAIGGILDSLYNVSMPLLSIFYKLYNFIRYSQIKTHNECKW